jgi:TonB family protein
MLQATPTRGTRTNWFGAMYEDKQRRRLVIAAILLLAAITAVLVRDYTSSVRNDNEAAATDNDPAYSPSAAGPPPILPVADANIPAETGHSAAATGHEHSRTRIASNPVKREKGRNLGSAARPSPTWGPATPTVKQAASSDQAPTHQQQPSYPLLTQATAVQGAVLMQALIAADGSVQEMRIISGPTILVSAARQAVQQWRFKPYLINGKPVETYARVTVNFTIDVSNTEARYHVDSVTSSGAL